MKEIKDKKLLGINIVVGRNFIKMHHEDYIIDKCKEFKIDMDYKVYSPMDPDVTLIAAEKADTTLPYRQLVGSLMHSMVAIRPDIAFAVGVLSRFANAYDESHFKAGLRV